jgi:hypothetical protein
MNLETLIDQWIGEEIKHESLEYNFEEDWEDGYNEKTQDLKSRKQELIEGIVVEIKKLDDKCWGWSGEATINEIIKELTGK